MVVYDKNSDHPHSSAQAGEAVWLLASGFLLKTKIKAAMISRRLDECHPKCG
jgi:hypothetical protein